MIGVIMALPPLHLRFKLERIVTLSVVVALEKCYAHEGNRGTALGNMIAKKISRLEESDKARETLSSSFKEVLSRPEGASKSAHDVVSCFLLHYHGG
jgi:hypothetical protein